MEIERLIYALEEIVLGLEKFSSSNLPQMSVEEIIRRLKAEIHGR